MSGSLTSALRHPGVTTEAANVTQLAGGHVKLMFKVWLPHGAPKLPEGFLGDRDEVRYNRSRSPKHGTSNT